MFSRLYSNTNLVANPRRVSKSTKYLPLTKQIIPSTQGCRHSSTSNRLSPGVGVGSQIQPSKENKDVTSLDRLVNVIRARSDPTYSSVMPMRSPLLWSETAFNENTKAKQIPITSIPLSDHLSTRSMMDSYSELVLPFGTQKELLEQYINATGGLRIGKLMENLDSLAGSIAYKHVLGPGVDMESAETIHERGFFIVTAAVDRLDMLIPLFRHNVRDLRLSGHIIHTGSSSMEVVVKMELLGGKEETVLLGRFSMVCRDAFTQKARPIPQLRLSTPEEQALFNMGAAHKERRKALALKSLNRVPPSTEEVEKLHRLYLNHGENAKCESHIKRVWMEETCLENCILMFPQERNVHSKIFGGYLMRLAYELGIATAALFSHRSLRFLSLDSLSFSHPVQIGSILRLRSKVALTAINERYPALVHTTVGASVVDVKTGKELKTNDFRFTWCDDDGEPLARRVVPRTYQDAMEWIEAKRAVDMGDEIRRIRDHDHLDSEVPLH